MTPSSPQHVTFVCVTVSPATCTSLCSQDFAEAHFAPHTRITSPTTSPLQDQRLGFTHSKYDLSPGLVPQWILGCSAFVQHDRTWSWKVISRSLGFSAAPGARVDSLCDTSSARISVFGVDEVQGISDALSIPAVHTVPSEVAS